jgi:hypothetical protein
MAAMPLVALSTSRAVIEDRILSSLSLENSRSGPRGLPTLFCSTSQASSPGYQVKDQDDQRNDQ